MYPALLLSLLADTHKICAEERIHAGDADDHDLRLFLRHFHDFANRLRDFLQMPSGHKIRLIHQQVEHSVAVTADAA